MFKISDALREILKEDDLLSFGLNHQLLNLSQTAKFIKPLVEARVQKEVQIPAIVVNLARYQRRLQKNPVTKPIYKVENLAVQSNLGTLSFTKSPVVREQIDTCYKEIRKQKGLFLLSEGNHQITLITDRKNINLIKETIREKPIFENNSIAGISASFSKDYLDVPGFSYHLMQKLALQNINLVEYCSTCTEINFFVDENQVSLAFETLRTCF